MARGPRRSPRTEGGEQQGRTKLGPRLAAHPPAALLNPLVMRRGQAFAPLGAAAFEHKLATLRAHAYAEAMSLGAAAVVRLKSPFHTIYLSINVSTEKIKAI
jgi:hypothetical protein